MLETCLTNGTWGGTLVVQSHKRCWNKEAVLQNWTGTLSPVVTFVSVPNVNFSCPDTARELKLSLSTVKTMPKLIRCCQDTLMLAQPRPTIQGKIRLEVSF